MTSPYLTRIRDLVGHELLLLPSVTVLVFDDQGRVLLGRHRSTGYWVAPGGMVEPDEGPASAAVREFREETTCQVRLLQVLGVFGGPQFRFTYKNGDQVEYVMTVYRGEIVSGNPVPTSEEFEDLAFVSRDQIHSGMAADWLMAVLAEVA